METKNIIMNYPRTRSSLFAIGIAIGLASLASAQPPGGGPDRGGPGRRGPGGPGRGSSNAATTLEAFVAKWLSMDENSDGKLSSDELKDDRLKHLFKQSDKNSDGVLTQEEMKVLFEATNSGGGRGGPRGRGGAGGGPGGPGGPNGRGGRPDGPPPNPR